MDKTSCSLVIILLLVLDQGRVAVQAGPLGLRYKVCTVEELRRSVEQICIRYERDSDSSLSLTPYGSVSNMRNVEEANSEVLLEILKASVPYSQSRLRSRPQKHLFKRDEDSQNERLCDYLDSCCHESCVISPEDLAPHCKHI